MITANKLIFEAAKALSVRYEKCCDALIYINSIQNISYPVCSYNNANMNSPDISPANPATEVLYVLDSTHAQRCLFANENLSSLTIKQNKNQPSLIPENKLLILVSSPEQSFQEVVSIFEKMNPMGGCIVDGNADEITSALLRIQQSFVQTEAELLSMMLMQENDEKILRKAEGIFGHPFGIYWRDFRALYTSEKLRFMNEESGDIIESDLGLHLIMDKKFHDVLQFRVPFYYYDSYWDVYNYCWNIYSDHTYLARLVLVLPKGMIRLHKGEEEIFFILSRYISNWGLNQSRIFRDSLPNALHEILEKCTNDVPVEEEIWNTVLNSVNWSAHDSYTIISYQFLAGEKWLVHKEITLSFLIAQLEREWPHSCAIQKGDDLIWLINLTKTGVRVNANDFHQKVATFIREYVCVAGVSPEFRDITQIPSALKAADISLRLGRKKDPHYWYYLYEDYRKHFLRECLLEEMPISMLVPPAILFLEEYDRENNTELLKTLKAYLQNGFNMTTAANRIFVHRTTFFRRMEKIEALTGLDLGDEAACQDLLVGFWLMG